MLGFWETVGMPSYSAPECWPLFGAGRSRDQNTGLWLANCHNNLHLFIKQEKQGLRVMTAGSRAECLNQFIGNIKYQIINYQKYLIKSLDFSNYKNICVLFLLTTYLTDAWILSPSDNRQTDIVITGTIISTYEMRDQLNKNSGPGVK